SEGQPMLLDFNLAADAKQHDPARAGGTLAYMAPEQLEPFLDRKPRIDARSDVYSLGMVLYELLTGRHPFPPLAGPTREALPQMVQQRHQAPSLVRPWNAAVTPAVEAVVRRCLEADPDRRYQTAR